ncbi:hypothetical protein [Chondromyces apiculatus]|uniref:Uncharacterized protein n=1 Tax=Chondromyces apiculatus DSM 436 TaxID=1192034 RepID=A0A017T8K9_9BACT|nr:hypothetical protein [Chondromyces apiculatus]EYF05145.1 Hypothetical protein CAP_3510 [Chondromyces apiculatus DSM 436]
MTAEQAAAAWAVVQRAVSFVRHGKPHHEVCRFCRQPLRIEHASLDLQHAQLFIGCPCGKSNGIIKGL